MEGVSALYITARGQASQIIVTLADSNPEQRAQKYHHYKVGGGDLFGSIVLDNANGFKNDF